MTASQLKFLDAVRAGHTIRDACEKAGIRPVVAHEMLRDGSEFARLFGESTRHMARVASRWFTEWGWTA